MNHIKTIRDLEQEILNLDELRAKLFAELEHKIVMKMTAEKIKEYEQEDDDFELRLILKE